MLHVTCGTAHTVGPHAMDHGRDQSQVSETTAGTLQVCFLPKVATTPAQPTFNDRRNCPGEPLGWLHHKPLTCNSPSTFLAIRLYQMSYMGAPHHAPEQHRAAPAGMSLGSSSSGCCPATLDAGWEKRGCSSPMLPTFPRRRMSPCL